MKPRVLFICTHNSARSQMAEGLLRAKYGELYKVESAGTEPSEVHPTAIAVLAEIGIDIAHHRSQHVDEYHGQSFDIVVTVCDHAKDVCPFFPGAQQYIHADFSDPSAEATPKQKLDAFRRVRDQISQWIDENLSSPGS